MSNRMLFRLFDFPILLLVLAIVGLHFLGDLVPNWFSGSAVLEGLANGSRAAAPWVASALMLASFFFFTVNCHRLWRWNQGNSDCCFVCGGIVDHKHGRYGPYKHCLACGKNQKN
ncbi:hypothetical protein [Alloalcanivorax mobilis]|uniref:hypothetical protein n=1 Tax=Alloalcanivorax mobilis TaxID=2019569 RepID=UPI0012FFD6A1|nr:hypothetical protein [Alloalcanivorax mobilis]